MNMVLIEQILREGDSRIIHEVGVLSNCEQEEPFFSKEEQRIKEEYEKQYLHKKWCASRFREKLTKCETCGRKLTPKVFHDLRQSGKKIEYDKECAFFDEGVLTRSY